MRTTYGLPAWGFATLRLVALLLRTRFFADLPVSALAGAATTVCCSGRRRPARAVPAEPRAVRGGTAAGAGGETSGGAGGLGGAGGGAGGVGGGGGGVAGGGGGEPGGGGGAGGAGGGEGGGVPEPPPLANSCVQ